MDKLSEIIKKRKEAAQGQTVFLRSQIEEQKRKEYEEQQSIVEKEEEMRLGKRLQKLEEYYDFAKLKIKKIEPKGTFLLLFNLAQIRFNLKQKKRLKQRAMSESMTQPKEILVSWIST